MKLPDYTKSIKWVELRELMGVKTIKSYNTKFKKKDYTKPVLKKEGVDLNTEKDFKEITNVVDGTFEDKETGRKLAVYIKEWRGSYNGQPKDLPRFHLTNCSTLKQMRAANPK